MAQQQISSVACAAPYSHEPLGNAQLTLNSSPVGLASGINAAGVPFPIPAGAVVVLVTVEAANVRWCDDGQSPTTTFGTLLVAGQAWEYAGNLAQLRFAAVSGTPVLDLAYYG